MAQVSRPDFNSVRRVRNLNGVIPTFAHPAALAAFLNSLHGYVHRGEILIPMDDTGGVQALTEVDIPLPIWGPDKTVRIDVLGYATARAAAGTGGHAITFTSTADVPGVQVRFDNFIDGATAGVAMAEWRTTGERPGDGVSTVARSLICSPDGSGFETVTYAGNASVNVYAIQFKIVKTDTVP